MGTIWFGTVAALGALAVIGLCCHRAQASEGNPAWRAVALSVSSLYALGGILAVLFALAIWARNCDDACGGSSWTNDEGAWQWPAQLALAVAAWLLWAWGFVA
ncbi:MAG: hypothetical protein M9964_15300 [Solirubrobacterales bacterium]|nr:hypothetical protein [Solirubrobacterales bacterium]MCO5328400.1 hypothetical protein [Solirubrobacterales bacterium]